MKFIADRRDQFSRFGIRSATPSARSLGDYEVYILNASPI